MDNSFLAQLTHSTKENVWLSSLALKISAFLHNSLGAYGRLYTHTLNASQRPAL